jgi:hypothetical protein
MAVEGGTRPASPLHMYYLSLGSVLRKALGPAQRAEKVASLDPD